MTRRKSDRCERRYLQALGSEHSILTALTWLGRQRLYLLLQPCPVSRLPRGHLPTDAPPKTYLLPPSPSQWVTLPHPQMASSMCPHHQIFTHGASAVSLESALWSLLKDSQHLSSGFSQLASSLPPSCCCTSLHGTRHASCLLLL